MTWTSIKIGEICDFRAIRNIKLLPYVGMEDVESNSGLFIGSLSPKIVKSTTSLFDTSCILYGKLRPYLNKVFLPDFEGHCSTEFVTLRPDLSKVSREWLTLWLRSELVVAVMTKSGSGARMPRANLSLLKNLEFPLPPLEIQKKIVKKIEELFGKIDEVKQIRNSSSMNAASIIPSTLSEIFNSENSKDWQKGLLRNICGVADGTHNTPSYFSSGVPLITSKNLTLSGLSFDDIKYISQQDHDEISKRSKVSQGDLLLAMIGTIGNITSVDTDRIFSIKNVGLIRPDNKKVIGRYIYYYLNNSRLLSLIKTGGTTQKFISLGSIRNIEVEFPSIEEQKKIVVRLDALTQKVWDLQKLQAEIAEDLFSLKQSILHIAFRGELN